MSANNLSIATFEPVIVEQTPGIEVWICMDDRPPDDSDNTVAPSPYYQTPGGVYGIAHDLAVAREAYRTGSFTNKNQSVDQFAAALHAELLAEDIYAILHELCAGEGSAADIDGSTVRSGTDVAVFGSALLLNPRVTSGQFENTADITGRLLEGGHIADPTIAYDRMRSGSAEHAAIPSVNLKKAPHDSLGYVALWQPGRYFDTVKADAQDIRAYAISMGALERLHHRLAKQHPSRVEDFLAATSTRTANIQSHHLLGPNGKPLPIFSDLLQAA